MGKKNSFWVLAVSLLLLLSLSGCCLAVCAAFGVGLWALVEEYKEGIYVADFLVQLAKNISASVSGAAEKVSGSGAVDGFQDKMKSELATEIGNYQAALQAKVTQYQSDHGGALPKRSELEALIREVKPADYFPLAKVQTAVEHSVPSVSVFTAENPQYKGMFASYSNAKTSPLKIVINTIQMKPMKPAEWETLVNGLVTADWKKDESKFEVALNPGKAPQIDFIELKFDGNVAISDHNEQVAAVCGTPDSILHKNIVLKIGIAKPSFSLVKLELLQCGNFKQEQKNSETLNKLLNQFLKERTKEEKTSAAGGK